MNKDNRYFKWYNLIGFFIAFVFYFKGKTLDAIWIMSILIYNNIGK